MTTSCILQPRQPACPTGKRFQEMSYDLVLRLGQIDLLANLWYDRLSHTDVEQPLRQ